MRYEACMTEEELAAAKTKRLHAQELVFSVVVLILGVIGMMA